MHPGPINRGVEIMGDVADGAASVILDQVASGVAGAHGRASTCCAGGDREAAASRTLGSSIRPRGSTAPHDFSSRTAASRARQA